MSPRLRSRKLKTASPGVSSQPVGSIAAAAQLSTREGNIISEEAKMMGMTPPWLTRSGR